MDVTGTPFDGSDFLIHIPSPPLKDVPFVP